MSIRGTIFDLKRFAVHDGPGIRTTVFLKGCPLSCWWCHNPESLLCEPEPFATNGWQRTTQWVTKGDKYLVGREITVEELLKEIERDVIFFDESGGGITISGGEPFMQPGFLEALIDGCRQKAIHVAVDTSGHVPWPVIETIRQKVDLFLYDLKLMDEEDHVTYIGTDNRLILENLRRLHDVQAPVIIRIPLIPGITDVDANLSQMADYIATFDHILEINLLPYNPLGEGKYRRFNKLNRLQSLTTQSDEALLRMKQFFSSLTVDVKIGG